MVIHYSCDSCDSWSTNVSPAERKGAAANARLAGTYVVHSLAMCGVLGIEISSPSRFDLSASNAVLVRFGQAVLGVKQSRDLCVLPR
jgi:hypothetical protein